MKLLSIESSGVVASCAISQEEKILATSSVSTGLKHSETLMVLVDYLFKNSKISLSEIEAVAVSVGPGSFTGLRVGIAAAKGIATGLCLPCVGIETLKAFAYYFLGHECFVCPCIDARRDKTYCALFEVNGLEVKRIVEDSVKDVSSLNKFLKNLDRKIFLVGDAANKCKTFLTDLENVVVAPSNLNNITAVNIALLASDVIKNKQCLELEKDIVPKYLRLSQAEFELKNKKGDLLWFLSAAIMQAFF